MDSINHRLSFAIQDQNIDQIVEILEIDGIHYIELRDDNGWFPLHQAAKTGNVEIVKLLIQCKTNLLHRLTSNMESFLTSRCRYSQQTPIHIATLYNRCSIIEVLVEFWLKYCSESISTLLTTINAAGYPPIHSAIRAGYSNVVQTLFRIADEHQVNIESPIFKDQSLFYSMAQFGHVNLLDILYQRSSLSSVFLQKDKYGRSLLHLASSFGHVKMVEALLDFIRKQEIDFQDYIDCVDGWGQTPLHAAILGQHVNVARKLIHLGSQSIDRFDLTGMTPLIAAISRHCVEGVEMLIQRGSRSVDVPSMSNQPPLYWAIHWRIEEIIEILKAVGSSQADISPISFYPFQYDILLKPISNETILSIRHRIYFAPSLTERLLFW